MIRFSGRRKASIAATGAALLLLVGATAGLRQPAAVAPSAVARVAPFAETIVETGTISAQHLMLYASSIGGGQAKILELAPEGHAVEAGDLLVRFDTSVFEQERAGQRAALRRSDGELIRAYEDAQLDALRAQGELEMAQQQIGHAERGLANEKDGRGRIAVAEAEAAAADATRELDHARTTYEDMKPLLNEAFVTRAEFDRAEQLLRRAEDQKKLAATRLDAIVGFDRPATTSKAESELNNARANLSRQGDATVSRTAGRQAAVAIAQSRVAEISARLAALDQLIDRATIRATREGLVVYREIFFGSESRKPQVGDEVFPNQPIIAVPDSSQLTVETRIREIDLSKVSGSQKVQVRVDAYPDVRLPGAVTMVGALAQADVARAGAKFFPVTITLLSGDPRLRTGMTARVEIEVVSLPAATVVPIQAVFDADGHAYVIGLRDGRPERRPVKVAAANESLAAIAEGVAAGDRLLLIDPARTSPPR